VLDAAEQDAGWLAGGVEFALPGRFFEEAGWLVAACFGVGEDSGEGGPVGVGEDAGGVVGDGGA
jgi:hypothetical protein